MAETYLELEENEILILTAMRHWINIFPIIVATIIVLLFMVTGIGWLTANTDSIPEPLSAPILSLFLLIMGGLSILIAVISYLIFIQNRLILTNHHLIQITQNGLFNRTVSKLTLDEIQDVRGTKKGVFPTILNYGEILIETAGSEPNFLFKPVSNPLNLAETINDAHKQFGHAVPEPNPTP